MPGHQHVAIKEQSPAFLKHLKHLIVNLMLMEDVLSMVIQQLAQELDQDDFTSTVYVLCIK